MHYLILKVKQQQQKNDEDNFYFPNLYYHLIKYAFSSNFLHCFLNWNFFEKLAVNENKSI